MRLQIPAGSSKLLSHCFKLQQAVPLPQTGPVLGPLPTHCWCHRYSRISDPYRRPGHIFIAHFRGALISRCLTDLEPQVFYPTQPHPLISISLDLSFSRYPPRSRVMPNKWTFFWDLDNFWRLFGHPAPD